VHGFCVEDDHDRHRTAQRKDAKGIWLPADRGRGRTRHAGVPVGATDVCAGGITEQQTTGRWIWRRCPGAWPEEHRAVLSASEGLLTLTCTPPDRIQLDFATGGRMVASITGDGQARLVDVHFVFDSGPPVPARGLGEFGWSGTLILHPGGAYGITTPESVLARFQAARQVWLRYPTSADAEFARFDVPADTRSVIAATYLACSQPPPADG
jgi:hypothetical protein